MAPIKRFLRHLFFDEWRLRKAFKPANLKAIEAAIGEQERRHDGELRFVVESALPFGALLRGCTPRERAVELFGALGVWDTEENSGVLIYLLLADKDVEIVADRGIDRRVGHAAWEAICGAMQREFHEGRFEHGVFLGVQAISDLLAIHFPPRTDNVDELHNRPVVL